ncbi:hypothetical protein BOX15_Mlig030150g1 [Macrostomum lignano]|uniref:Uncharacterized protein n=1 Tax=Macrostomum lignano TaxID=282301 RepID=A0A267GUL9_9PLAT|nr:hypothetical protein BOX15_Mlig030150g1 [Macrostomum lignano]
MCIVRSCYQASDSVSPYSGFALCQQHLGSDLERLEQRETEVLNKLNTVAANSEKQTFRLEQQAIQIEMQEIDDMFESVQARLQLWKEQLVSSVQQIHDAFASRLRDVADAEHCLKDIHSARSSGKLRKVMKLILSVENFADEAVDRSAIFDDFRARLREITMERDKDNDSDDDNGDEDEDESLKTTIYRCIGDVSSEVQMLQSLIDKHMHSVMEYCQIDGESPDKPVCPPLKQSITLPGEPRYLTLCTNTSGYVCNMNDCVVSLKSVANASYRELPMPTIFVALRPGSSSLLLGVSFNMRRKFKLICEKFDWNKAITGLHCDNLRQRLFLAQEHAVTVTDLCGQVIRVVATSQLGLTAGRISGMSCNGDKVFVIVLGTNQQVLSFSKASGVLESCLDVSAYGEGTCGLRKLCLQEGKIWLADWKSSKVLKVCSITGQLISTTKADFRSSMTEIMPLHLASDDYGRLYVSELKNHSVQSISSATDNDEFLFGSPGEAGNSEEVFNRPADIIVFNSEAVGYKILVVADTNNMRLCAFRLV